MKQKELRRKWVEALRSGDYIQTHGFLEKKTHGIKENCCLGVLCHVLEDNGVIEKLPRGPTDDCILGFSFTDNDKLAEVQAIIGIRDMAVSNLILQNDGPMSGNVYTSRSKTFQEIADEIERHDEWFII